jgi:hypothetical protein
MWNLILLLLPNHQIVNTRNSQCNGQPGNKNKNKNNNNHNKALQSHLAEFLRTRPTTFSEAKDPMDAEDWLKGVEKKLVIAQCTDREKVLFAAHQLYGTAANW